MDTSKTSLPLNTLEKALDQAEVLAQAIERKEGQDYRRYRLFLALTHGRVEALAAFCIWRTRGATQKELGGG